jgi:hypothetical protein
MKAFAATLPMSLLSSLMLCLLPATAQAQTVHRCGNTYSQTACPQGGQTVDATDARSAAQRADARRVVADDRRLAADMRRDRLADEKAIKPTGAASLSAAPPHATPAATPRHAAKKKKRVIRAVTSDDFTAFDPSSRKRKRGG